MGLDIVEFVMGVEEAFEIRIPDVAAERITTPRKLIDYVHSQLFRSHESRCLSQRAFYFVRQALSERLNLSGTRLRPHSELLAYLPQNCARETWAEVGQRLGITRWPSLWGVGLAAWLFPCNRVRTLGDAAQQLATFTPTALKRSGEGWSWHEVRTVVDGLMRHHFAVRDYSLDDHFTYDLGLD